MSLETIIAVVGIILGSAGLFSFLQFLINRKDKKKDDLRELKDNLNELKDNLIAITKELKDERDEQSKHLKDELAQAIECVKDEVETCITNQGKLQLDTTRLQMLVLMKHFPEDTHRLMQVAEKYFVEMNGDWYMSSLFAGYCEKHYIPKPDWFKED